MTLEVAIRHRLGDFTLDAAFTSAGRVTALFGRSGAGKTSLVNIIGGLVRPDAGRIVVDGETLVDTSRGIFTPKHRRRLGYIFQDARLFPHLSVRGNLLYGQWFNARGDKAPKLDGIVALLGLEALLARRPSALSGGEKQRVAIGRALLANPRLLLMDEPLAALDDARKAEILPYLERLRDEARVPIVYVSHSVAEVARLASIIVALEHGTVSAIGPVGEVMGRLDFLPVAGPAEAGAVLDAVVAGHDDALGITRLETAAGLLSVARLDLPAGARLRARIRARDVMIATQALTGVSALNLLPGRIVEVAEQGRGVFELAVEVRGQRILALVTRKSVQDLGLAPGREVTAVIKSVALDGMGAVAGR
ncbi:MAG: molybdenum ABC transporter ATP-binding protein [Alphaproteobacteria bacterium]|nr:molybdenum ABC transporter ATP-binding protein [Alphaproteobacteria bacterium]